QGPRRSADRWNFCHRHDAAGSGAQGSGSAQSVPSHEILRRLGEEGPVFLSFFFSFVYCGLLWLFHHLAMHFFRHMQVAVVWLNLLFLMSISILPFSCALLGRFMNNRAVLEIYFGNLFLAALLLLLQWMFARKRK